MLRRFGERLVYLGFLPCFLLYFLLCRASIPMPLSPNIEAVRNLKKFAVLRVFRLEVNLPRTLLLLPPMSIILLFLLASSYTPGLRGTFFRFSELSLDHFLRIGIFPHSYPIGC